MGGVNASSQHAERAAPFQTHSLPAHSDVLAPDLSEIRILVTGQRGSMAHGTLPPGRVSLAVRHQTVEELWFVVSGRAEIWRKLGAVESVDAVGPGTSLSIPVGTHFQFRTVGDEPFCFIMVTMPPWPGADEAVRVPDHWPVPGEPR